MKYGLRLTCISALTFLLTSCLVVSLQKQPVNKTAPVSKRASYNFDID